MTDSGEIAETARLIANHGQVSKNLHVLEGRNSRMDGIQAAVLSVKLPYLESWISARRNNAEIYNKFLAECDVKLPESPESSRHTYHLYAIQVAERDKLQEKLGPEELKQECIILQPCRLWKLIRI